MKKLVFLTAFFLGMQTLHAQLSIYAGQGIVRQKVGFYENATVYSLNKDGQSSLTGTLKQVDQGRIECWGGDGRMIGYIDWNSDPMGASTMYAADGKKKGFVCLSNGSAVVYSLQSGKPELIGGSQPAAIQVTTPLSAAAAALLLLFDWC